MYHKRVLQLCKVGKETIFEEEMPALPKFFCKMKEEYDV